MNDILIDWVTINNISARFDLKVAFVDKSFCLYIFSLNIINLIGYAKRKNELSIILKVR